jgi:predicted phage baseplate assembly protein
VWAEPTAVELDLRYARVLGNVVPISAGVTRDEVFSIGESDQPVPRAVERSGPNGTTAYLFTLPDKAGEGLVRLGPDPHTALPEIDLVEAMPPAWTTGLVWTWRRALLGTNSSTAHDRHFTLDDGTWDRAVTYRRIGETIVHRDYLAGIGTTVRFGDGVFGQRPAEGNAGVDAGEFFRVRYRLGNGVRANVPAEAVRHADPNGTLGFGDVGLPFVERVWNPLPTSGGLEPASADEIRRDAPYAFQTVTHRAVRPEDYNDVAARLPWVQRAGTRFRWTGSWLTAFTAADARGLSILPASSRRELAAHLDRFRQTGREVHVLAPRYVDLDLRIAICVEPASYVADVVLAVMRALVGKRGVRPVPAFFDPDRFTFGTALDRSELEAAVQRVPGVRAVKAIYIARRGWFAEQPMVDPYYQPGIDEVIRVDNDPRHPDRGTIKIDAEGGA